MAVIASNETGDGSTTVFNSLVESRSISNNATATDILRTSRAIKVSPDGKRLAVIRDDNQTRIIPLTNGIPNLARRELVATFAASPTLGRDVSWDAAGNLYAISSGTELMRVWSPGGETTATPGSDGTFVLDVVQLPEVSVVATDDFSSESGPDTATLTFTRTESTTAPLKVNNSVAYSFPNPSGFTRGNTMIGHNDQADSVGSTNNFVIFDNVRVVTSDARVSSVQLLPGNQMQIDFTSPGSEAEFHLEGSANLSTGIWNEVAGAVISTRMQLVCMRAFLFHPHSSFDWRSTARRSYRSPNA